MKYTIQFLLVLIFAINQQLAFAHKVHASHDAEPLYISTTFDLQGNLWRASTKDSFIWVDKSTDLGKTFTKPVKVNAEAQNVASRDEERPKIATDAQGGVYLTWAQNQPPHLKSTYASYVWFAKSSDNGKSFEKPYVVHQNRADTTHAFNTLNVTPNGNITVLWIDGRDALAAKQSGKAYAGLAIYYAVSSNAGKSFHAEQRLADYSCECCRISTTTKPDGTVVALWRHVFEGNERDHMMAEIPQSQPTYKEGQVPDLKRATYGHWKIDGCPHHGAALAKGGEGKDWWGYHMAYFDGNDNNINKKSGPGLYYSRMDGVAWASSVPKAFGNHKNQAGHPALLSVGDKVWLVWRELEGKNQMLMAMFSDDGGKNWQAPKLLVTTSGKADYPELLTKERRAYLVWNTAKEGLRVIELLD